MASAPIPAPVARRGRRRREARAGIWYPRAFWPSFSVPAILVLILLFLVPFYATLAVAFGTVDPIFNSAVPVWNPLDWNFDSAVFVYQQTFLRGGIYQPVLIRTILYVGSAVLLCLVVGYPVAYFASRHAGRWKAWLLVALLSPFWIAYLMRMLAWINVLEDDGLVNRALMGLGIVGAPIHWLEGQGITVVLGLVYGYIPYMILPLYASLDRIDPSVLEAARDLGASPTRTFLRVTLPLSRQAILAGTIIVMLPMLGDFYTVDLLSGRSENFMLGNVIDRSINSSGTLVNRGAAMVLLLLVLTLPPMIYYLWSTGRAARRAG